MEHHLCGALILIQRMKRSALYWYGIEEMELGKKQKLTVVKFVDFGAYLAADQKGDSPRVLLPAKEVPDGSRLHDTIEVFLYKDSKDRLIATTRTPALTLGGLAVLRVAQVTKIGAFLDWGLEKDLFLPYKQQLGRVKTDDEILVTMYIDKSGRLCASMRGIYHLLKSNPPYEPGDTVTGRVYEFSDNFGVFVGLSCYVFVFMGVPLRVGLS